KSAIRPAMRSNAKLLMRVRCGAAIVSLCAARAALADSLKENIDKYVRQYADADLFSGVVLVAKKDSIVYEAAFGQADRGLGVANRIDTKFQIASLSKPITALAILQLAEQSKLSLEDHLAKFIPDFPRGDKITIEQLLTHYSGLGDASAAADYNEWSRFPQTTAALVDKAKKVSPVGEPGAKYFYSNSNYHLLAFIIERVSGEKYGDYLKQHIFKPAGMLNTAHRAKDETIVADLANGYVPAGAKGVERATYLDWTSKTGNGSLYSTAADLLRFDRALSSGALLKPEAVKKSYGFDRKDRKVGTFWFHRQRFGHRSVYVNGSSPGFKGHIERFIDDGAVVVVLSNMYIAAPSMIAEDIGALLFDQKPTYDVPHPVSVSEPELKRCAGKFRFGDDFFQKNAEVQIEARADHLDLIYSSTGFTVSLIPIGNGQFFDRVFWSFVRFEKDKLIYRNGETDYVAAKESLN
ncbi:MAG TPA: serine hydrolase domain-containing protein, partial [Chthoniobacterales bacterium]|nr:serine hydrolase domain-containing protein [Chthoniobacterales bacterium]